MNYKPLNSKFLTNSSSIASIKDFITDIKNKAGLYMIYCQKAEDNPEKDIVSFAIINKPLDNGAYSHIWLFVPGGRIYHSSMDSKIPDKLTFNKIL